ncbi:MAG: PH domain-containing protein [bacterium]
MNYESLHLDPDEHVILEVRKHWIVFFGHALSLFLGAFLPFAIFVAIKIFLPGIFANIHLPGNTYALFLFFYSLWILFLWISFFLEWTKYYLDVWYVTEKRIIDVEQKRIFDREITNLRFDKIQDVTIDVHGFVSTMLNFGNIKVQTAGEGTPDFTLMTVKNPDEVRRIIFSQHNEIGDAPIAYAKKTAEAEEEENLTK